MSSWGYSFIPCERWIGFQRKKAINEHSSLLSVSLVQGLLVAVPPMLTRPHKLDPDNKGLDSIGNVIIIRSTRTDIVRLTLSYIPWTHFFLFNARELFFKLGSLFYNIYFILVV